VKILFVDLEGEWRGGQSQALLALRGFREAGHHAELVGLARGALAGRAQSIGITAQAIPPRAARLAAAGKIRAALERERYDIVHANEPHALTAAWLAGAHKRAALIASRRVALPLKKSRVALARYRAAQRIIAISHFVAESMRASGLAQSIAVVHDGVEIPPLPDATKRGAARRIWGVEENQFLLGCVSYLLPEKGQKHALEALSIVKKYLPSTRLLLAGDGPCREELERHTRELGLKEGVIFAGHLEDVASVYRALDLFLFPSLAEPLGSSLLTAMAHGLPVVALESGGVPEVVRNGRDGLLVNETRPDYLSHALANAVLDILRKPELARALGAAARETIAERFSARRMAEETLRVYEEAKALKMGGASGGRTG